MILLTLILITHGIELECSEPLQDQRQKQTKQQLRENSKTLGVLFALDKPFKALYTFGMETSESKIPEPMSLEEFEQLSPEEQAEQLRKLSASLMPNLHDFIEAGIKHYKDQAYIPTEEQVNKKFWKDHTIEELIAIPNEHRLKWLYDTFREYYKEGASGFWDWEDNENRVNAAAKIAQNTYWLILAVEVTKKRWPDGSCRNLKYSKRKRKYRRT